jgi:small ligand-binding sensory domain FIST
LKAAAALSRHPIAATATGEVTGALLEAVGPGADQLFLVASRHHTGTLEDVVAATRSILGPEALTTELSDVVICGAQVVDDGPALAALAVIGSAPPHSLAVTGCRPVGQPLVVTAAEGDLVTDLASEPALAVLRRTVDALAPAERALAAGGLHLGVVLDEHQHAFGPGDFAVRSIRGSVGASALALDAEVPIGATVGRAATGARLRVSPDRPAPRRDAALLADVVGPAVAGLAAPGEPAGASVLLFGPPG